jgi:tetratricopeptide (TPR) repeat protein
MNQCIKINYIKKANRLKQEDKLEEAIATYRIAIEANPSFSWYYNNLGECLASQGNFDEAIANFYKAIELNPSLGFFYYNLAEVFSQKGSLEQAIACYNQAIEITSISLYEKKLINAIIEYDDLGQILLNDFKKTPVTDSNFLNNNNQGNLLKELMKVNEAKKKMGFLYFKIGQKLYQKGLYKESELILNSAMKLNNNLHWAHHLLACIFKEKHHYKQAIDHFSLAIKINPREFGHYWRLAQTYTEQGDINSAIETYNMTLTLKKDDRVKQEFDSLLMLHLGNNSDLPLSINHLASFNIENIINQYLDRPDILTKLGEFYNKIGKFNEANRIQQEVSIHFELASSSQVLLIIFSSRNDIHANIQFQFRKLLSQVDVKKIFIRDVHDAWYNKGLKNIVDSIEGIAEYLKEQIEQINPRKLITLGSSSGGYAALLFGFLLNADKSIVFSPQTKIPRPQPFPDEKLLVDCDSRYFDLLDLGWENSKTICSIHYSEDFLSDRDAAIRMKKLDNFRLCGYPAGNIHNIAGWLKNQGKLESILLEVI